MPPITEVVNPTVDSVSELVPAAAAPSLPPTATATGVSSVSRSIVAAAAPSLPPTATATGDDEVANPVTTEVVNPTDLPDYFNSQKLQKFTVYQIAWWDESHRKCCLKTIQGANGCEYITRVKRDENGNPTLDGIETDDVPVNVNVKYEKEVRFALGVALVKTTNGDVVGKRIKEFEYTEQTIIAEKDWQVKVRLAIGEVKSRTGDGYGWTFDRRAGQLFEDDKELELLPQLGGKMATKLKEKGLTSLKLLFEEISDPQRCNNLISAVKGLSKKRADACVSILTEKLLPGACPPKINHRDAPNPYLSRYPTSTPNPDPDGRELWEIMVSKSKVCKNFISVNRMIDHMFRETNKAFEGTTHQDDWMIYHDALSLFVAKESYQYMHEKGYFRHLIMPQLGLNRGTVYIHRMVGMRPEVMPMDAHLNQDLHENVDRHVNLTSHLPDNHPNKFSRRTPKHLAAAYKKIGIPTLAHSLALQHTNESRRTSSGWCKKRTWIFSIAAEESSILLHILDTALLNKRRHLQSNGVVIASKELDRSAHIGFIRM